MPDQLTLLAIDAQGNEQDGWETVMLQPTGITFEPNKLIGYYHKELRRHYPNLPLVTIDLDFDEQHGQVFRHSDGKPLFEIVPENTGK